MKNFFKNWKTTSLGITTLAGGIILLWKGINHHNEEVLIAGLAASLSGIGLIFSKDGNVTGVGADSKTIAEIKKESTPKTEDTNVKL